MVVQFLGVRINILVALLSWVYIPSSMPLQGKIVANKIPKIKGLTRKQQVGNGVDAGIYTCIHPVLKLYESSYGKNQGRF